MSWRFRRKPTDGGAAPSSRLNPSHSYKSTTSKIHWHFQEFGKPLQVVILRHCFSPQPLTDGLLADCMLRFTTVRRACPVRRLPPPFRPTPVEFLNKPFNATLARWRNLRTCIADSRKQPSKFMIFAHRPPNVQSTPAGCICFAQQRLFVDAVNRFCGIFGACPSCPFFNFRFGIQKAAVALT